MEVVVVGHRDVPHLLPMRECIDVMERAFRVQARGDVFFPLRSILWLPQRRGGLGLMPGHLGEPDVLGVKVVSVFPGNVDYESHQGAVLLFETEHGCLLAVIDAGEITAIRTAAASALATRLLAKPDAGDLAILGSGTQASTHLEAIRAVRDVRRVRVWSHKPESARGFAKRESERHGIDVTPVSTVQEAVRGADIVCTATAAREPILAGEWISAGAHINAVGACVPAARELDTSAVLRSRLFVDSIESAMNEAGDFLIPKAEGSLDDSHILGELGDVVVEKLAGRTAEEDITLFKSLGIAIEDVAAAQHIYAKVKQDASAVRVQIGGLRRATD